MLGGSDVLLLVRTAHPTLIQMNVAWGCVHAELSATTLIKGEKWLTKEEKLATSFQRLAHIVALLSQDIIKYLVLNSHLEKLKNKAIFT